MSTTPRSDKASFDIEVVGDAYTERVPLPEGGGIYVEAEVAKELERDLASVTTERDRLRAALEPFAAFFDGDLSSVGGGTLVAPTFRVQLFKDAKAALNPAQG